MSTKKSAPLGLIPISGTGGSLITCRLLPAGLFLSECRNDNFVISFYNDGFLVPWPECLLGFIENLVGNGRHVWYFNFVKSVAGNLVAVVAGIR